MLNALFRRSIFQTQKFVQRDIKEFYDTVTQVGRDPIAGMFTIILMCSQGLMHSIGRAWSASELRLKSFSDLHKLWFVLIKEKNMLLTERELHRVSHGQYRFSKPVRLKKVKKSLARIKFVLAERKRVYDASKQKIKDMYIEGRRQQIIEKRLEELTLEKNNPVS